MSLNIKNEKAHSMAKELAALTGQTLTAAVCEALQLRLDDLKASHQPDDLAQKLLDIGKDCSQHFSEDSSWDARGDFLYDELGLPK